MLDLISTLICLSLVLMILLVVYSPPRLIINLISYFNSDILFHINLPSNLKYISLTIDDFPNPNDLSISFRVLDELRKYNAKCTFFVIGSHIKRYEGSCELQNLFEHLIADGHEIGNHGWYDEKAIFLSKKNLEKQITDTECVIKTYAPLTTRWFRPGSGFFNKTIRETCKKLNYQLVLGSIYPHDTQIPYSKLNSFFILHKLYPGAIVILHDRLATVETLKEVLPSIKKRTFHIVTLQQLLDLKQKCVI